MIDNTTDTNGSSALVDSTVRRIRIIFFALCSGIVIMAIVALKYAESNAPVIGHDQITMLMILSAVISAGCVMVGGLGAKRTIALAAAQTETRKKLQTYTSASILRWATIEAPCLFNAVAHMLTGNTAFLIIFVALLMILAIDRPSEERLRRDLAL